MQSEVDPLNNIGMLHTLAVGSSSSVAFLFFPNVVHMLSTSYQVYGYGINFSEDLANSRTDWSEFAGRNFFVLRTDECFLAYHGSSFN
jgi:hypothetical protein